MNKNVDSTTSQGSKRGRPRKSKTVKSSKDNLQDLKNKYIKDMESGLIKSIKDSHLYEVFCDSLSALAFTGFTLPEAYKTMSLRFSHIMRDYNQDDFLSAVFQDRGLRNSFFSFSSYSIQGYLLKIIKEETKSNPNLAIELLKISYNQKLPELNQIDDSSTFTKKTTDTLNLILEGLEGLGDGDE